MMLTKETILVKDEANKKIRVTRDFDAPANRVWQAWTEKELLDQWWAPRPWQAVTVKMDFREGGYWFYYMLGPDGTRHYCRAGYEKIVTGKSFSCQEGFCDEQENITTELPGMHWLVVFRAAGEGTKVDVEISFASLADLEKIIEMGFQEGFTAAHGNLDELLAK